MTRKNLTFMLLLAVMALFGPAIARACPGCANALGNSAGFGFNTSILFMMAMPFVVAGSIGVGLIYTYRRAQKKSGSNEE